MNRTALLILGVAIVGYVLLNKKADLVPNPIPPLDSIDPVTFRGTCGGVPYPTEPGLWECLQWWDGKMHWQKMGLGTI